MKKRILSIMIVAALAVSMTACDTASDEATAESESAATASTTEKAEEEKEEEAVETAESVTETEAEVVEPVYINNVNADNKYDGVTFETTDGRVCYYRYSDKKIFDLSEHANSVYSAYCSGDIAVIGDNVVNMNTGTVLYDLASNTKRMTDYSDRIFSDTGSLILDVSSPNFDDTPSTVVILKNDGSVIDNAVPHDNYTYASLITDRYIVAEPYDDGVFNLYDTSNNEKLSTDLDWAIGGFGIANDKYVYFLNNDSGVSRYDINNGKTDIMFGGYDYYGMNSNVMYGTDSSNGYSEYDVIGTTTDETVHFNIRSFTDKCDNNRADMKYICSDYMLVECFRNNNRYFAMLDRNGNTFFDPIQLNDYVNMLGCSDDYIAVSTSDENFIIDINAKTVTNLDEGIRIKAFDRNGSDTLVIEKDGYYFLADAATPNELYSPFDNYVE